MKVFNTKFIVSWNLGGVWVQKQTTLLFSFKRIGFRFVFRKKITKALNHLKRLSYSEVEVKIDTLVIPKREIFKYLGSVIQGDGAIDDDVAQCIRTGWMKCRLVSGYCVIRMCHQGLKVSFTEWWLDQHYCMGTSSGQSRKPTYKK